jgi:putative hydrolase of the HAD superfamily
MFKLVVFNLWDTLAKINGKQTLDLLIKEFKIKDKKVFKRKFNEIYLTKHWNSKFEAYRDICRELNLGTDETTINKAINISNKNLITIELFPEALKIIQNLKRKYKLAILSNTSIFLKNILEKETKLLKQFDYTLFSYDLGELKPNLKVFQKLLNITNLKPEEILYVSNDNTKDLKPAKSLGMRTILYKDFEQLKKDLENIGI